MTPSIYTDIILANKWNNKTKTMDVDPDTHFCLQNGPKFICAKEEKLVLNHEECDERWLNLKLCSRGLKFNFISDKDMDIKTQEDALVEKGLSEMLTLGETGEMDPTSLFLLVPTTYPYFFIEHTYGDKRPRMITHCARNHLRQTPEMTLNDNEGWNQDNAKWKIIKN